MRELPKRPRSGQRGALIVVLMAGIAIAAILSGVAAQKWSDVVRRDAEAEMIFRAQDLVRALKRYQKDKGRLPNTWDELIEPGQKGQYFVRKLWKDPLVRGGKWQTIYATPQGGLLDPSMPVPDPVTGLGSSSSLAPSPPPGTGSPAPGAPAPMTPMTPLSPSSSSPTGRAPGIPDIIKKDDGTSEVSGLPIAGVKSRCKSRPFRVYKDKTEYSLWVFSVFDLDAAQTASPAAPPAPGKLPGTASPLPTSPNQRNTGGPTSFPPR